LKLNKRLINFLKNRYMPVCGKPPRQKGGTRAGQCSWAIPNR